MKAKRRLEAWRASSTRNQLKYQRCCSLVAKLSLDLTQKSMCLCVVAAARVACTGGSIDQTPTVSENGLSTSSTGQTLASLFRQGKWKQNLGCLQKNATAEGASWGRRSFTRRMRTSGICGADAFLFSRYALHNQTSSIGIRAPSTGGKIEHTSHERTPHTSFFNHKGGFTNRGKYWWGKARTSGESQPIGGGLKERKEEKKREYVW